MQSTKDIIAADKKFRKYSRIGLKFLNFLSNVINCKTQKISFCWHHYCWRKVDKICLHWLWIPQLFIQCNSLQNTKDIILLTSLLLTKSWENMVALALYGAEVKTRSVQHWEIYTEESKEFKNFKIMKIYAKDSLQAKTPS